MCECGQGTFRFLTAPNPLGCCYVEYEQGEHSARFLSEKLGSGKERIRYHPRFFHRRGFLALLVMPALAAIGIFGLTTTPADAAGAGIRDGRLFRIITPGDDALVRGERTPVKLALRRNVSLRNAHLNGKRINRLFSSRRSGTRQVATLMKSKLKKLLPLGRNFLRFVVRRGGRGGKKDYEEVAFNRVRKTPNLIRGFKVDFNRSRGARVTFRPSTPIAQINVRLNGRNVSKQFREGTPLRRDVLLGASDGLRHGVNRLRIRAHTHHGAFVKLGRNFRVARGTTIAGAGPDQAVLAGQIATLNGKASRKALQPNGRPKKRHLRYNWKLIRRPEGSEARLVGAGKQRPEIQTDLPGTYLVKLRTRHRAPKGSAGVARRARTSGDIVSVPANPQPRAAISTFASVGGKSGISVDVSRECEGAVAGSKPPCFYPNPGSDEELQVVVLDRRTLEPQSNKSYKLTDLSDFAAAMKGFRIPPLNVSPQGKCPKYDTSKLVLLALRSELPGDFDLKGFAGGYSIFNIRAQTGLNPAPGEGVGCPLEDHIPDAFPFSTIGIPGTILGRAWENTGFEINGPDGSPGVKGSLDGFLKRSSDDPKKPASEWTFTFPTSIQYDTRRTNGGGRTEFAIGTKAVAVVPDAQPANSDGLSVFSFDPINPEATLKREAFISHSGGASTGLAWGQLETTLKSLGTSNFNSRPGIGITSNGQIGGFASEPESASFQAVLEDLELFFGANGDTLARAVNQKDGKGTYSMISVPPLFDFGGTTYQSSSAMAEGVPDFSGVPASGLAVNNGRLTGTLQRGNNARVYPSDGDPTGTDLGDGLLPIVYAKPVDWLLTPEPEATGASCQEVAFAFITTQIDGLFAGGAPTLWKDASADACQGRDFTGTSGPFRADNLDSNHCSASDPDATGAIGANVRGASMTLRGAYQSISTTFSQEQIKNTTRPADAPFTDKDLNCAKLQMVDELAARDQVTKYMDILQKPQQNLQGKTVVDLGQIAENIKTGTLAKVTKYLKEQNAAPSSFWSNFAFGATNAIGTIGSFFAPETGAIKSAFQFMSVASKGGQSIFNAVDGPSGNPVKLTNEYILLAAELDREAQGIKEQVQNVLSAQQNGVLQTEGIILSDPHMLAEVNARSKGEWQVTVGGLPGCPGCLQIPGHPARLPGVLAPAFLSIPTQLPVGLPGHRPQGADDVLRTDQVDVGFSRPDR